MAGIVRKRSLALLMADAVGVGHFVVAGALVLLGESTSLLSKWGGAYPGIEFVYQYIDVPMFHFFSLFADPLASGNKYFPFFAATVIIFASSVLYGFIAYLLARFFATAIE